MIFIYHFYFPIDKYKYICLKFKKIKFYCHKYPENVSLFMGLLSLYGKYLSIYKNAVNDVIVENQPAGKSSLIKDKHTAFVYCIVDFFKFGVIFLMEKR